MNVYAPSRRTMLSNAVSCTCTSSLCQKTETPCDNQSRPRSRRRAGADKRSRDCQRTTRLCQIVGSRDPRFPRKVQPAQTRALSTSTIAQCTGCARTMGARVHSCLDDERRTLPSPGSPPSPRYTLATLRFRAPKLHVASPAPSCPGPPAAPAGAPPALPYCMFAARKLLREQFSSALFVPYINGILKPQGFQRCALHVPQRTVRL